MMIWKTVMILIGIIILCADFWAMINSKLTGMMGIGWGILSIFIIVLGAVPGLSDGNLLVYQKGYEIIFLLFAILIIGAFFVCISVSQLSMKNQELAMQVSLLNQENEKILDELEMLTGKAKTEL